MERYDAYKDSGVEWIGDIPSSWMIVRVKQVATYTRGSGIQRNEVVDEGLPCVRYGELYTTYTNAIQEAVSHIPQELFEQSVHLHHGDLVMSLTGETKEDIGPTAVNLTGKDIAVGGDTLAIRSTSQDSRFLSYALNSEYFARQKYLASHGEIIVHLGADSVGNSVIVLPTIEEQFSIVDYLDAKTAEIDALIADCVREVELLQEYRKAVISEAVTKGLDPNTPMKDSGVEWIGMIPENWELSRVGWLSACLNGDRGTNYPSGEDMLDEGVPFVVTDALHGDEVDPKRCKFISNERYELLGGVKLRLNDIAYCLRGSVGTCAINTFANEGTVASSLMAIRPMTCNSNWLYYVLISEIVYKQVESYMNGTCAANLSADGVSKFRVPLPLVDEQETIATYLNSKTAEIDSLIETKQTMADKLREYRKSLISEAVTGKFKVPGV